ncbi:hypothetical protein ACFULT_06925 [Rhodococcus sp. NPDC057297]|uniref:hypothetical protein n=1 Tax=Rhodococcus sp. NPDC057297 TaxID=3346090 RepID=UPI0036388451
MDFEGLLFRSDALASGVTDGQLRHARLRGELIAVRPGAFVSAAFFATLNSEQQHLLLARAIAHEAPVVLSHQSAAIAWGMDVWALPLAHAHSTTGRTITARKGRRRIVHGSTLSESESTVFHGLSLTTPARTVVDIARCTTFERAVCVGDSALRRGLVTRTELDEALCSARHRTGIQNAVRAVAAMTDRSDSVGESRTRLILVDAGSPSQSVGVRRRRHVPGPNGFLVHRAVGMLRVRRGRQVRRERGRHAGKRARREGP